jgi:hypothetical protein
VRRVLAVCLIAFTCAIPALAAPAALAVSGPPARTSLDGFVCERSSNALDRVIAVVAVMRPVTGTQRMELKFVLQRRTTGSFATVQGGDLGHWLEPNSPTLGQHANDVWRLRKLVANLPGPASYRFRVSFRWVGAGGAVLDRSTLTSATCSEPQ